MQQDAITAAASIRDVPASCRCVWSYDIGRRAFVIVSPHDDCPWHRTRTTSQETAT